MTTATDIFPSRYLTGAIWCDPEKYPQWKKLPHSIFDLYNYLDCENQHDYLAVLEDGLQTFAGQILLFHMKDCTFNADGRPKQVPFGTGELDLEAILSRIKKYDENAVLTLEETVNPHITHAVKTIKEIWERV